MSEQNYSHQRDNIKGTTTRYSRHGDDDDDDDDGDDGDDDDDSHRNSHVVVIYDENITFIMKVR